MPKTSRPTRFKDYGPEPESFWCRVVWMDDGAWWFPNDRWAKIGPFRSCKEAATAMWAWWKMRFEDHANRRKEL